MLVQKAVLLIILFLISVSSPHWFTTLTAESWNQYPEQCTTFSSFPVTSCSIFTVEFNNSIYFAGSEDESGQRRNTRIWFDPAEDESTYGCAYLGFVDNQYPGNDVDGLAIAGMNTEGLCFDANGVLPVVYVPFTNSGGPKSSIHYWEVILRECATVEDVIEWHQTNNMGGGWGNQIHWADANGDAVVISAEENKGIAFTRKTSDYLISTNFNLANTSHGYYPCTRYNTVKNCLDFFIEQNELTYPDLQSVLSAVHLPGTSSYIGTVYSIIFEPLTLDLTVYILREYSTPLKINIKDEVDIGDHELRLDSDLLESLASSTSTTAPTDTAASSTPIGIVAIMSTLVILIAFRQIRRKKRT